MVSVEEPLFSVALHLIDTDIAGKGSVAVVFKLVFEQPSIFMATPGILADGHGLRDIR